jgi:hypothetical protein
MRLAMSFPDDLPGRTGDLRGPVSLAVRRLLDALDDTVTDPADLLAVLRDIPVRPDGVKLDRWQWHPTTRRTEQFSVLDTFFGISRTSAESPEMFSHAAAVAYRALLAETATFGTDLNASQWNQLRCGLEAVVSFGAGARMPQPAGSPVPIGSRHRDPHRRWRAGHQIFFPLVQGVLVGIRCFADAALAADIPAAREAAGFATVVMGASARALEFAADFAPENYGTDVRPSMTPPGTPQPLSGLMSADHHHMVAAFHEVRPVVAALTGELRDLYDAFVDSVEDTYQAHRHVCSRFNGDRVVSLRMNHGSSMAAAEVLDQLGRARVKMLRSS